MFSIKEKYLGTEKQKQLKEYKENPQKYMKKLHPISRELHRYYNPKFHKHVWYPNGLYNRQKYYYYVGPSLGFRDKEGNKKYEKIEDINSKTDKIIIKDYIEYKNLKENEYKIIIEYCSNCDEHQVYTFHNSELYHNYAINLQKCILLRFPFIQVLLKPIETDIKNKFPKIKKKNSTDINNNDYIKPNYDIKIGAFEVLLLYRKDNENKKEVLYSKLKNKQFPKILDMLEKILDYLPMFYGKIITYEKDENKNKDKEKDLLNEYNNNLKRKNLIEGLEIKIYKLNNLQIIKGNKNQIKG